MNYQATVITLGVLHENTHLSNVLPIVISGTCKKECATAHGEMLSIAIQTTAKALFE